MKDQSDFVMRQLDETYLPTLRFLETSLFRDPWSEEMLAAELKNIFATGYAALDSQGAILGYYFIQVVAGVAELHNIAVAKEWQGRGIGDALIEHAVTMCREAGADSVHLEVRESNTPARRLYEKHQFKIVGKRERYYNMHPEDAILYTWDLNELV